MRRIYKGLAKKNCRCFLKDVIHTSVALYYTGSDQHGHYRTKIIKIRNVRLRDQEM